MNSVLQRTVRTNIEARGVGLHTGEVVNLALKPAPADTGIVFRRVDINPVVEIPAKVSFVGDTTLCTSLMRDGVRVSTVEHLMSAIAGLGIDNLYIELNASEVPIMDGSSAPFVFLLQSGGIIELDQPKRFIRIKQQVSVQTDDGAKHCLIKPFNGFKVDFEIRYDHPVFSSQNQCSSIDFSSTSYLKEVSRARTFGFMSEFEYLLKKNLALGASLDNAIAIDDYQIVNKDGLRYPDEFVKHKVLDAIGDLYLLGYPLIGEFVGFCSGHSLNKCLLDKILACEDAWELISYDKEEMPIEFFELVTSG